MATATVTQKTSMRLDKRSGRWTIRHNDCVYGVTVGELQNSYPHLVKSLTREGTKEAAEAWLACQLRYLEWYRQHTANDYEDDEEGEDDCGEVVFAEWFLTLPPKRCGEVATEIGWDISGYNLRQKTERRALLFDMQGEFCEEDWVEWCGYFELA